MSDRTVAQVLQREAAFTTRSFALLTGRRVDTAARTLKRLAGEGTVVQVTRGVWCQPAHPHFSKLGITPHLLGSEHGYVSFLTAMHVHGLISQIPGSIQAATTGKSRRVESPIGTFEFFHVHPRMMRSGLSLAGNRSTYQLADPEKALLDTLYLSTRKGRRFSRLPEIDNEAWRPDIFMALADTQIPALRIRNAVKARAASLLER